MGENDFPKAPKSRFLIRDANGRMRWCVFRSEEEIAAIKEKWKCRQERYQLNKAIYIFHPIKPLMNLLSEKYEQFKTQAGSYFSA